MNKDVSYPDYVTAGITRNHRAHPLPENLRVFGSDTETVHGRPHTVQLSDGGEPELFYVDQPTVLPVFWNWIRPRMRTGGVNVCYFHNLAFDAMILFSDHRLEMYEQVNAIEFVLDGQCRKLPRKWWEEPDRLVVKAEILFGKVNAATLTEGKHYMGGGELKFEATARLHIFDSRAFTQASLSRSLSMFHIPESKLPKPDDLGHLPLKTPEFEAYAKQDVKAQWALGRRIMDIHAKYKVRPSVSLPQFISRVFRHDFFKGSEKIAFPPVEVVKAAEFSYHGGKNGLYASRGVYEDVYEADINSAFPWAMRELPTFLSGRFETVHGWAGPDKVGVYCLTGETDPAAVYPLIFDHLFRRVDGAFEGLWHTSYETEKILAADFVKTKKIWGYIWHPGGSTSNPFRDFVDHFYKLKAETPREDPYYNFYKIALNALYGKLVGVIEEHELSRYVDEEDKDHLYVPEDYVWDSALNCYARTRTAHKAGQMYNPFIASLITGRVRALLYDLETKYEALHSATDSIKTRKSIKEKPGLGGWKEECFGRCYIFRNKLYLHFDKSAGEGKRGIKEDGQRLVKYALHAYKGSVEDLYKNRVQLLRDGSMKYKYTRPVGLREGLRRKMTPGDFVEREETVTLKRGRV